MIKSATPRGPQTFPYPMVSPAQPSRVGQSPPLIFPQPHSSRVTSSSRNSLPAPVQKKTLFIVDSISSNVSVDALENAKQSKFATAKAYSSIHDTEAMQQSRQQDFLVLILLTLFLLCLVRMSTSCLCYKQVL